MTQRVSSNALRFYVCKAEGITLQVMCQKDNAGGSVPFEDQHEVCLPNLNTMCNILLTMC